MNRKEFFKFLEEHRIDAAPGCNEKILKVYENMTGQTVFSTFHGWKEKGRKVKKGASSFPIFSRPVNVLRAEKEDKPAEEGPKYYNICHLFSEEQTEPI